MTTKPTTPQPTTPPPSRTTLWGTPPPASPNPRTPRCPVRCELAQAGDECTCAADLAEVRGAFRRRRHLAPIVLDLRTGRRAA